MSIQVATVGMVKDIDKELMTAFYKLSMNGIHVIVDANKNWNSNNYTVGHIKLAEIDANRYVHLYVYHRDGKIYMLAEYRHPFHGKIQLNGSQFIEHFFDNFNIKSETGDCLIGVKFEDFEEIVRFALERVKALHYNPDKDVVYFN